MNKNEKTLVAVYGSLMSGLHNHYILEDKDVEFLGEAKTPAKFSLYSFGGFPALVEEGDNCIEIEVYSTSNESVLRRLDQLEGFISPNNERNFYNKKQINTKFGKANIYIIDNIKHYNVKKINTTNWKNYATQKSN